MATREEIRREFYTTLVDAATGSFESDSDATEITLDADDVSLHHVSEPETYPHVTYDDAYRRLRYNEASDGEYGYTTDDNGGIESLQFHGFEQALFTVQIHVRSSHAILKERLYESIRRAFGTYRHRQWDYTDFHPDCDKIDVGNTTSLDDEATEQVSRVDELTLRIDYHRVYDYTDEQIEDTNVTISETINT